MAVVRRRGWQDSPSQESEHEVRALCCREQGKIDQHVTQPLVDGANGFAEAARFLERDRSLLIGAVDRLPGRREEDRIGVAALPGGQLAGWVVEAKESRVGEDVRDP